MMAPAAMPPMTAAPTPQPWQRASAGAGAVRVPAARVAAAASARMVFCMDVLQGLRPARLRSGIENHGAVPETWKEAAALWRNWVGGTGRPARAKRKPRSVARPGLFALWYPDTGQS